MDKLTRTLLMDPGADAGAGGATATATDTPATEKAEAKDDPNSAAQSAPGPLKVGDSLLNPKPSTGTDSAAASTGDAADSAYKGINDKFGKDGHDFDDAFFTANPHAKELADSYRALQSEYGKSQQSLKDARSKSVEKNGLPDEIFQTLDLTTNEQGVLTQETIDKLLGKTITPLTLEYFGKIIQGYAGVTAERTEAWKAEMGSKLGIETNEVLQWANASGFYNETEIGKLEADLADPFRRDKVLQRLAEDYLGSGAIEFGTSNKPPLQTGNTAGANATGGDVYGDITEFMSDIEKAQGNPGEIAKAEAKLKRSHSVVHSRGMTA